MDYTWYTLSFLFHFYHLTKRYYLEPFYKSFLKRSYTILGFSLEVGLPVFFALGSTFAAKSHN